MANEIEPLRQTAAPALSADHMAEKIGRAVKEHAPHFDRHGRAADLAGRLEFVSKIAARCGWEEPYHSTAEKMSECLARQAKESRRTDRLLRGLDHADALRREVLRLAAENELADLARRAAAIMRPAGADVIAQEFAASLAAAPNSPESGALYVPTATAALAREGFSMGAVILGLGDIAAASARRFGRAPIEEIRDAIEARETELEDHGDALNWLAKYAAYLPTILAEEQARAEAAKRERRAAEVKAAEAERRRIIQNAASAMRRRPPEDITGYAPDILDEARALIAAEDEAHAQQQAKAKADAERNRAALWGQIAAGDFRHVRWPHHNNFDEVANAFELDPTSPPEQVAALRKYRKDEAAPLAARKRRPFPRA